MNPLEREKITRFLNDKAMSSAVYKVLQDSFIKKKKEADVHVLAATTLSLYALDDAWKDLQKVLEQNTEPRDMKQIGL